MGGLRWGQRHYCRGALCDHISFSFRPIIKRIKELYADRFHLEVTEPLGFENTFAMVIRSDDAQRLHLHTLSDIVPVAPKWRAGVGYEEPDILARG